MNTEEVNELTRDQLKEMSLEDAKAALSNAVYAATVLVERLQVVGKVRGNGHHARQNIAAQALKELEERWNG